MTTARCCRRPSRPAIPSASAPQRARTVPSRSGAIRLHADAAQETVGPILVPCPGSRTDPQGVLWQARAG